MRGGILAKGSTHDKFNLVIGSVIAGIMVGTSFIWQITLSFIVGWLLATFVLTPDLDSGPKQRRSFISIILYPYSVMFKHRGVSHNFFLGTLTRVIYIYFLFILVTLILAYFSIIPTTKNYLDLIISYDYEKINYLVLTWIFVGMFLADTCHIVLDRLTSLKKSFF